MPPPPTPSPDSVQLHSPVLHLDEPGVSIASAGGSPVRIGVAELEALWAFAERVLTSTSASEIAGLLLGTAVDTYGFARGAVLVGERPLVVLAGHAVLQNGVGSGVSATVDRAHFLHQAQVVEGCDPSAEPLLSRLFPVGCQLLVLPLGDRRRLGALVLELPAVLRGPLPDYVLAVLSRLTGCATAALYREQRLAQLERLASTDDLTMIANRRSFNATLDREIARSVRNGEPLSLVLLDLDLFKQVNDRFGHPAGDESLRNVAASLVVACRDFDTPARYGGEEFAVILPNCSSAEALLISDRLREAVSAAPGVVQLTASAGVASYPQHSSGADDLIEAADVALLEA